MLSFWLSDETLEFKIHRASFLISKASSKKITLSSFAKLNFSLVSLTRTNWSSSFCLSAPAGEDWSTLRRSSRMVFSSLVFSVCHFVEFGFAETDTTSCWENSFLFEISRIRHSGWGPKIFHMSKWKAIETKNKKIESNFLKFISYRSLFRRGLHYNRHWKERFIWNNLFLRSSDDVFAMDIDSTLIQSLSDNDPTTSTLKHFSE